MKPEYCIIIAPEDDLHARAVHNQINKIGLVNSFILDIATFPIGSELSFSENPYYKNEFKIVEGLPTLYGDTAEKILIKRKNKTITLDIKKIKSIWKRRFRHPLVSSEIKMERFRTYASHNTNEAIKGWLSVINEDIMVVNNPLAEERASQKFYQMYIAKKFGLKIPKTCISNDPQTIKQFTQKFKKKSQIIYKSLISISGSAQGTQIFNEKTESNLNFAKFCPTIFQEKISGSDLRIVVVGKRFFAIRQNAKTSDGEIDIRMELEPDISSITLPKNLEKKLLKMQRKLGLKFGAYDFKLDSSDNFWFLEVNPSGQWLWLEESVGHPISESLASYLTRGEGGEFETRKKGLTKKEISALESKDTEAAYSLVISRN